MPSVNAGGGDAPRRLRHDPPGRSCLLPDAECRESPYNKRVRVILLPTDHPVTRFPDPRWAGRSDVVAIGENLFPETLRAAYRSGVFPWPHGNYPLPWFCPLRRAVLEFDRLHVPESLAKARRKSPLTITVDRAFPEVIAACAVAARPDQESTWINDQMRAAYTLLHRRGDAHSVEAWDADGKLVGGLYGVDAGGVFCGESMFYRAPNASKLCLLHLIDHARERGGTFLDIQQLTPHMERLGAREIPRADFLKRLASAQESGVRLFDPPTRTDGDPSAPVSR
jgi:leucyl/phenylalanyl-tRNA---protein transferase